MWSCLAVRSNEILKGLRPVHRPLVCCLGYSSSFLAERRRRPPVVITYQSLEGTDGSQDLSRCFNLLRSTRFQFSGLPATSSAPKRDCMDPQRPWRTSTSLVAFATTEGPPQRVSRTISPWQAIRVVSFRSHGWPRSRRRRYHRPMTYEGVGGLLPHGKVLYISFMWEDFWGQT